VETEKNKPPEGGAPKAAPSKAGRVQYENRTRTRFVIDHPDGDKIFGQSVDRDAPKEALHPVHRPSPVVTFTREEHDRIPEYAQKYLASLVAKGHVDRRELP
jgi:hypothetical protein